MFLPSVVKSTAHSLCISVRRRNREPGCPPVYNPLTSWNAWPDGSGWWDNGMGAQHLPQDLMWPSSGLKNLLKRWSV